ncbi:MAG: PSD1 and planctomycete cytochrome C domain-containing protein [Planctomycetota bacterium]
MRSAESDSGITGSRRGTDRKKRPGDAEATYLPAGRLTPCRYLAAVLLLLLLLLSAGSSMTMAAEPLQFGRDILPILSDNCFFCHGPDEKNREANLRLDTEEGAIQPRETTAAIVRGKSAMSELMRRITSSDPELQMPPPKSNRKLTPQQIELVRRWIDEGAVWGKHWAFEPPVRPQPPLPAADSPHAQWPRNPIDHFVLDRLRQAGMSPSPAASRETLIRRVTLDLTGLPPTPEEVREFVNDSGSDAYEKVVDRLLKSPRYGERMVWEWLDAARYADTNGYQGDPTRSMYFWRDWVIRAINDNMPFDRFTIEQLAGDLLPSPTQDQFIATGFHRNHMINGEGGRIAEESRVDYVQDRVETTGTVWMGLTFNCCRCHDHKFDPFSQREYYQLAAYFNSIDENGGADAFPLGKPILKVMTPEIAARIEELKKREGDLRAAVTKVEADARPGQAEWEKSLGSSADPWQPLSWMELSSSGGATLKQADDHSVLVSGSNPAKDDFVLQTKLNLAGVTGFKLEALPDASLVNSGPGRADNGNFVLSEIKVLLNGQPVALKNAQADFAQEGWPAANAIDGKAETGWAVMPQFGKPHGLTLETAAPIGDGAPQTLTVRLEHQTPHVSHVLGRFRLLVTNRPVNAWRSPPDHVKAALAIAAEQRNDTQKKDVSEYYLASRTDVVDARKRADDVKKEREKAENETPSTMIMRERTQPRATHVLKRGAWDQPADAVSHGVPKSLPPLPENSASNRLALAEWLVAPQHPLTARVTANRTWQTFFGVGLVKTAEDFGVQGERPSHPELLDWLACELREPTVAQPTVATTAGETSGGVNRWNMKHLVRLIVTSATYRQSSAMTREQFERDPENRLLSRSPRYRLPSWMLRDQALAVSGLLVEQVGGKPVKGYQPPGIWEDATFGQIRYEQDHGLALYRRSLYLFWRRIVGPTVFFDVASRQTCQVKTARTNTPLHALVTLNDVTYVEAARHLAQRVLLAEHATDEARITEAFQRCTSRTPRPQELAVILNRLRILRADFVQDEAAAKKLIGVGESKASEKIAPSELAAFTGVASLLLNLDETVTKE